MERQKEKYVKMEKKLSTKKTRKEEEELFMTFQLAGNTHAGALHLLALVLSFSVSRADLSSLLTLLRTLKEFVEFLIFPRIRQNTARLVK